MALPDTDLARIRRFCQAESPEELRDEVRIEFRARGSSVTIFECRPPWHEKIGPDWIEQPIAQLRYNDAAGGWTLYWRDRNSRWHLYVDQLPDQPAQRLLDEIKADPTSIFWG
jgi:Protein of unknown function (DUF3024)